MKKIRNKVFIGIILFIAAASAANANGPSIWSVNSRAAILQGDARSVSVSHDGTITPAPKLAEIFKTDESYIWATATDAAGNIYLGTGGNGRIFKVSRDGKGTLLADLGELNVSAIAAVSNGRLFAATSPDGKVYSIDANGTATPYFDPKEKYIWSLATMPDGSLMVGTGENGKIFRVRTANAELDDSLFFDSSETHITSLISDAAGNVYAGTDPGGIVLRFGADGKAFALLDSELREIHGIAKAADGTVYVLALGQSASRDSADAKPESTPEKKPVVPTKTPAAAPTPAKSRYDLNGAKTGIYRIAPDGSGNLIWSSTSVTGFSIFAKPGGGVYLGTSDKGRVYHIADDGRETLVLQSDAGQISRIFARGNDIFAASSNPGVLYSISGTTAAEGIYESAVLDAKTNAKWGRIWWRSSGNVQIRTRSGNTEDPDETWSDWSAPLSDPKGGNVTSVNARFIQWQATLRNGTVPATLSGVDLAYINDNIAPEVLSITLLPANVGLIANPKPQIDPNILLSGLEPESFGITVAAAAPRKVYQRGARSFTWTAEDRNDDTLVYDVLYKEDGDETYRPLAKNIEENFYSIDGASLPDGRYTIKVVAKDSPANPSNTAASGELISEPFEIDNTQPEVSVSGTPTINGGRVSAVFSATDASSYITRAEYSINGGPWRAVHPDDGISDSPEEHYTLNIQLETRGENTIVLRVFDAVGNSGNAKTSITY